MHWRETLTGYLDAAIPEGPNILPKEPELRRPPRIYQMSIEIVQAVIFQ